MNLKDKITKLSGICKGEVVITVNEHKTRYQTVKQLIEDDIVPPNLEDDLEETPKEVVDEMINKNEMVCVRAYPDTPVGFYSIYHYDLEKAVDEMIQLIQNQGVEKYD